MICKYGYGKCTLLGSKCILPEHCDCFRKGSRIDRWEERNPWKASILGFLCCVTMIVVLYVAFLPG